MAKRYSYNKANSIIKGAIALGSIAYFIAIVVFAVLLGAHYLPSLLGFIDLGELEGAVNAIYLRLDAFLLVGLAISVVGFILCCTVGGSLRREKGGFKGFVIILLSASLIVFYFVLFSSDAVFGYILNYALGGILLVGILGVLLGLIVFLTRVRIRMKMARSARKFERNYLKYEKYNR